MSEARGQKKSNRKRRRSKSNEDDEEYIPAGPRRRSTRLSTTARRSYAEADEEEDGAEDTAEVLSKRRRIEPAPVSSGDGTLPSAAEAAHILAASNAAARQEGSSRDLEADVEYMVKTWLGKHIPYHLGGSGKQAKRAVMQTACASSKRVRFSRMSGIQQWENAVFLFVNVGGEEYYENVFSGDLMKSYARVAQEHVKAAAASSSSSTSAGEQVPQEGEHISVRWFA